eukprot:TRINITY_DN2231_c1_g1_i1.p1 TRINITY_DN2231_c1_g1~~TRINITY_DN2231_c1_g1_i1.p1  ORF type:complete len:197 (-),score=34.81 TRINITY_DN2231_c1_g1_i1:204-734(-)
MMTMMKYITTIICLICCVYVGEIYAGYQVTTYTIQWAGGIDDCWGCNSASYACSEGFGSGDWADGKKYYEDTMNDVRYVITDMSFDVFGSFDCFEDELVNFKLNNNPLASVTIPRNDGFACLTCQNCLTENSISFNSTHNNLSHYNYGGANQIELLGVQGKLCLSTMNVTITYYMP